MKKILVIILAILCFVSCLSGCAAKEYDADHCAVQAVVNIQKDIHRFDSLATLEYYVQPNIHKKASSNDITWNEILAIMNQTNEHSFGIFTSNIPVGATIKKSDVILHTESLQTNFSVLYAKTDIPIGVRITHDNIDVYFESREVTDGEIYEAGIPSSQALEILEGVYTKCAIHEGTLITVKDFSYTNIAAESRVPEGKVLIAIDIPPLSDDVATPYSGDVISVLYKDMDGNSKVYDYLQYVQVYKTPQSAEEGKVAFVLAVNDGEQARQLVEAAYSGNYYFVIASSGDPEKAQELLSIQDDIIFNATK